MTFPGIYPKQLQIPQIPATVACTCIVLIAEFLIMATQSRNNSCLLTDECINTMCYSNKMEYYSVMKRSEVLLHVTTWINLENIMRVKEAIYKGS